MFGRRLPWCRVPGARGSSKSIPSHRRVWAGSITSSISKYSAMLAAIGGLAGLIMGALATLAYALAQGEPWVVPLYALVGAPAAGLLIGGVAGLYPATKAARLSPTEALRAT